MLILARRVGETVKIGDNVTATVLGVKANQVRLGFNAPKDIKIYREELLQKMQFDSDDESQNEENGA